MIKTHSIVDLISMSQKIIKGQPLPVLERVVLKIKNQLDKYKIGHNNTENFSMKISTDPFFITTEELSCLNKKAFWYREWLRITNELYLKGLQEENWRWVVELIDGKTSEQIISLHRELLLKVGIKLPLFARADQSNLKKAVELQVPGSGWAWSQAINETFLKHINGKTLGFGFVKGFCDGIRQLSHKKSPSVIFFAPTKEFFRETVWFADQCKNEGVEAIVYKGKVNSINKFDVVRRLSIHKTIPLLNIPTEEIVKKILNGSLHVEPPINIIYDQKVHLLLPFDSRSRAYFPDEIRELFPETYLVSRKFPGITIFDGEKERFFSWDDIIKSSRKKRQFVLKYGGSSPGRWSGSRAVYNMSEMTEHTCSTLLEQALNETDTMKEPWIIQSLVSSKFPVSYFDENSQKLETKSLHARICPTYYWGRS
ncbi:MAG: hypothetical protein Q8N88_03870, partial [Nanoarchaeota archaeon]|nr:hypothetical protein [Nanoarchaeota archaeon]